MSELDDFDAAEIASAWHSVNTWNDPGVAMYSVTSTGRDPIRACTRERAAPMMGDQPKRNGERNMRKIIDARDTTTALTVDWFPCHCDGCMYLMAVAAQSRGRDELALCDLLINQAIHNVGTEFIYVDRSGHEHSFVVVPMLSAWETEDTAGYYAPNARDMGGN